MLPETRSHPWARSRGLGEGAGCGSVPWRLGKGFCVRTPSLERSNVCGQARTGSGLTGCKRGVQVNSK